MSPEDFDDWGDEVILAIGAGFLIAMTVFYIARLPVRLWRVLSGVSEKWTK